MKKPSKASKLLKEILEKEQPDALQFFNEPLSWEPLTDPEKVQLAALLALEGKNLLNQGKSSYVDCFKTALQVAPDAPTIYYFIGTAYAELNENMAALNMASELLEEAFKLSPETPQVLLGLAKVNTQKAVLNNDLTFFDAVADCFNKLNEDLPKYNQELIQDIYFEWALSTYTLAKISGEACDYHAAIELFKKGESAGCCDSDFFNVYGRVVSELAMLIGRTELLFESIELHRKSLRESFDYFPGWLHLGYSYHTLFEITSDEEFYNQAADCYHMAEQIEPKHSILAFKWAQLLATQGKINQDYDLMEKSIEKFVLADSLEPNNPTILSIWAEVLLLFGALKEDVNLLYESQAILKKSLDIDSEIAEAWYLYGSSFTELGRYFSQENYYTQAIEKFQHGLKLKENCHLLWGGLAWAYSSIGDLRQDVQWLDKSTKFFARAIEFSPIENRQIWNDWAVALMKMAEITSETRYIEEALQKFEHIIPKEIQEWDNVPLEVDWLYNYGCAYDFLGDFKDDASAYELCIIAMQKVLNMDPLHDHARYNMALAMSHFAELTSDIDAYQRAIEQFQILVNEDNEDDAAWNEYGHTLLNLAELVFEPARPQPTFKLYELAESRFLRALALGNHNAMYGLACVYALLENYPQAMHYIERAEAADALPSIDVLTTDTWLDGLRTFPAFRKFLDHLNSKKNGN